MSLTLVIDDRAATEIAEAYNWYLRKSDQAAVNFKNEVTEAFDLLEQDIIVHVETFRKLRRCPLKISPYYIYQRKENEKIIQVVAFLHNKRANDFIE